MVIIGFTEQSVVRPAGRRTQRVGMGESRDLRGERGVLARLRIQAGDLLESQPEYIGLPGAFPASTHQFGKLRARRDQQGVGTPIGSQRLRHHGPAVPVEQLPLLCRTT